MRSAVVLSGGRSSRMGKDKGLIKLGGIPLVRLVAEVLADVADEVLVSVGRGRDTDYSAVLPERFVLIEDEISNAGPLEGLICGLSGAKGDYVLVSPCDTPFLRMKMCEAMFTTAKGHDGAVPKTGARYFEPLHGAYKRASCLPAFCDVLLTGSRRPTEAYKSLDIAFVNEAALRSIDPDLLSFWNINSPGELEKAERQVALLR